MGLLYQDTEQHLQYNYQVETLRERLFIANGVRIAKRYQESADNQICKYMGGADGVRRLIDKILTRMEQPCTTREAYPNAYYRNRGGNILAPPSFPVNGFKLFLRGDSIAYLTEVVEQHMVYRLNNAWTAALFRSNPKESHPYPMLCENDIMFIDSIRSYDFGCFHSCSIHNGTHCCTRLSFADSPKIWQWPDDNCLGEEIIGAEQRQHMVRAIASRAGIMKLTGATFDSIAAEILHLMATIVIDAFEVSKSLWYHDENIGGYFAEDDAGSYFDEDYIDDTIDEEDDHSSHSSEQGNDYEVDYSNQSPPPPETFDEEGKLLCVIVPRQIKDAAVRIGMKPLLDSQSWEAGEGRSRHEEVEEARLMFHASSSEDDSSDEESDDDADDENDTGEAADSNIDLGNHASEAGEDEVNMSAGEVVDAGAVENLSEAIEENSDENDLDSCSSLSY